MLTPMKAIRAKCLDCCCGSSHEVSLCPCPDCSLFPYRFGKNPNIKLSESRKAELAANFKKSPSYQGDSARDPTGEGKDTHGREVEEKTHLYRGKEA